MIRNKHAFQNCYHLAQLEVCRTEFGCFRSALRSGLISGSPKMIHPILAWILPRMGELKTRAYLAKYLMKVEIPQEIRADIEIEELYQQVLQQVYQITK